MSASLSRHLLVSRYCMKAFSPVSGGQVGFVSGGGHRSYLLFLTRPLVEPLRLFHPTVLLCIEREQNKKSVILQLHLLSG